MKEKVILYVGILGLIFLIFNSASAHRSGCHRWHSCPSDSGSYTCGDVGHPCQYPTYPASGGVIYPPSGYYKDCYDCPLKKVPSNAYAPVSGIGWSCDSGYIKVGSTCHTEDDLIKKEIENSKANYYKNPSGFREKLITKIANSLKVNTNKVIFYVYTTLPDVRH